MRIYLDNAATSWPKPETVYAAVDRYQRELGAPAGRSGYTQAIETNQSVEFARRDLARLLGVRDPQRIIFTFNGTDALNLAIHGLLKPGDHVVTTVTEHNSVLRPLRALQDQGMIAVDRVGCDRQGYVDPQQIQAAMKSNTRLVALCHASNVTGALQPAAEIAKVAHDCGALLLLDAAQSLGHVSLQVDELQADLLAAPGHKGLLGPLGTGLLYVRPGLEKELRCVRQGGTGTLSELDRQPENLPGKYEAGNLNVPGLIGLRAGVMHLSVKGLAKVEQHCQELTGRFLAGLRGLSQVRVHGPATVERRVGVVSLTVEGYDPQEVAALLDASYQVQVRPGLHCAPLMHQALGTLSGGGTVRFSFGAMNTTEDVDAALQAIAAVTATS